MPQTCPVHVLAIHCPSLEIRDSYSVDSAVARLTTKLPDPWTNFIYFEWESLNWSGASLHSLRMLALCPGGAILPVYLTIHTLSSSAVIILHRFVYQTFGCSIPSQWSGKRLNPSKLQDLIVRVATPPRRPGQVFTSLFCADFVIRSPGTTWRTLVHLRWEFNVCVWRLWWLWLWYPSPLRIF
mmetsp:Transcript_35007/g.107500  ORF Transcript_35007/g.107500 Transcript_35007/m.107500 type:complete len:183 (+) Transcript_35007:205-753(+)